MQQSNRFARLYREWCVVGFLTCAIAGFPTTPLGPLLLWAVVLPGIAGWLVWQRPAQPDRSTRRWLVRAAAPRQARRRRGHGQVHAGSVELQA